MVPGGLDGYWQQKIADFEEMKRAEGQEVTVLMDPVDSTVHFESVQNEIDAGLDLTDGFVIMASWSPQREGRERSTWSCAGSFWTCWCFCALVGRAQVSVRFCGPFWETPCRSLVGRLPDFLEGLKDLTDMVKERVDMQWNDVLPFVREKLCSYDQRVYLVPVDLDMMYVHYREDLRVDASLPVPNTWERVLEFAKHYHNTDLNNDGTPDFGLCFPTMEGGYATWNFMTVVSPYMQTQGTSSGAWFDTSSMDTLLGGEGFAEALRTYAETLKYTQNASGFPRGIGEHASDEVSLMGSVLPKQVSGRCALIYDWMASGTSSVLEGPWFGTSYVNNQVRSTLVGTDRVQHPETQKLVTCTPEVCPLATEIDGMLVNFAPYMAAGGLAAGINSKATAEGQELAFEFFTYMSVNSASFTTQQTAWVNPFRRSHLTAKTWSEDAAQPLEEPAWTNYVDTISAALDHPNACLDFRMPGFTRYFGAADRARGTFVREVDLDDAASIEAGIEKVQSAVVSEWNAITEETGRDVAMRMYRKSLGDYDACTDPESAERLRCVEGEYFDCDTYQCKACGLGEYSDKVGQVSCLPCKLGYFSGSPGAAECDACEPGTYGPQSRASECEVCAPGHECPEAAMVQQTPCRRTTYEEFAGGDRCEVCEAGMNTQFEGTASALCGCAEGSFCLDASVDPPQACPGHPLDRDPEQEMCVPCTGEYGDFQCRGLFECAPLVGQELPPLGCPDEPRCVASAETCKEKCVVLVLDAQEVPSSRQLLFRAQACVFCFRVACVLFVVCAGRCARRRRPLF